VWRERRVGSGRLNKTYTQPPETHVKPVKRKVRRGLGTEVINPQEQGPICGERKNAGIHEEMRVRSKCGGGREGDFRERKDILGL